MQLEELCTSLGIAEHIPALSEWRDDLLRANAAALQAVHAESEAALSDASGVLSAVQQERDTARATLVEHQGHADRLVEAARAAISEGDGEAIEQILHAASLFGEARENARMDAETAELQAKMDAIAAKKSGLK